MSSDPTGSVPPTERYSAPGSAAGVPSYSWTQPICEPCYMVKEPGRTPHKMRYPEPEQCAYCGHDTEAGLYVRDDPATVQFPKERD